VSEEQSKWLNPNFLLGSVLALAGLGSFWVNFDRRVSGTETQIEINVEALKEHKAEEAERLSRMESKIDRLIERGAK